MLVGQDQNGIGDCNIYDPKTGTDPLWKTNGAT